MKPNDILCRRLTLSFMSLETAKELLPEVTEILAAQHKWSSSQKEKELREAAENLKFML